MQHVEEEGEEYIDDELQQYIDNLDEVEDVIGSAVEEKEEE
jgi:hypothetical protein